MTKQSRAANLAWQRKRRAHFQKLATRSREPWTKRELAQLRTDRTDMELAFELKRTPNAIHSKRETIYRPDEHRRGDAEYVKRIAEIDALADRNKAIWTVEEDRILVARGLSRPEAALVLGRTIASVHHRRSALRRMTHPWHCNMPMTIETQVASDAWAWRCGHCRKGKNYLIGPDGPSYQIQSFERNVESVKAASPSDRGEDRHTYGARE